MKAIVVESPRKAAVREIDPAPLSAGKIRIRIEYCLICTWEKRIFSGETGSLPFVPGHEASGIVSDIHPDTVTSFRIGDRVVFKTLDHCGHCSRCYSGETSLCTGKKASRSYGGIPGSGGMAQLIDMDPTRVFKIAEDLPLEIAAFTEPLACCYHSVMRADILPGDFVGISGGGIMGQLHALLAMSRGAKTLLLEPDPAKAAHARAIGVHAVADPLSQDAEKIVADFTGGEGLDAYFITTPQPAIAEDCLRIVRPSGKVVFYGSFHPNRAIGLDPNKIHYSQVDITGSFSADAVDFYRAARLLSSRIIDVSSFVTGLFPLDRAQDAFQASLDPASYRIGIKLHG